MAYDSITLKRLSSIKPVNLNIAALLLGFTTVKRALASSKLIYSFSETSLVETFH